MQPAVINSQVSYTVPDGVTVTAVSKASLPVIFIGERLIVYAIVHQSLPPPEAQEGSIRLTGDLLGAKVEHKMKFQVPLAVTKENVLQVSTIHHLAAKKLIKEMELDLDGSTEIIKLSCDSNVISSQTAFIAIDEERKEAVKGSLETWDVLPDDEDEPVSLMKMSACLMAAPKRRPKGHSMSKMSSLSYATPSPPSELLLCAPPPPPQSLPGCASSAAPRYQTENLNILAEMSTKMNPLGRIINLQLASGAWKMSTELADVIVKTTAEIKDACPVPCEGDMETTWATIIVLIYLQLRQSNFKDEWELVAAKAETWLTKQNLPEGCSIQVLREKGTAFLS